ncbi:MAG: DUF177 domain-containing protein [Alistipes sp.]|nr:DUF177 domain-containing protein [Alistipes sp.]
MELSERYAVAFKELKPGGYDYAFSIDGALFRNYENAEIKEASCSVQVHLERAATQLTFDVRITGEVVVPCDRCLEDCRVPVDFEGQLLVRFSDLPADEYDGEVLWLPPAEKDVDLTQYLYESIVLSLPYQRVHPEGGCDPEMLKHFRIVSDEEFAAIEEQAEHPTERLGEEQQAALRKLSR